MTSDEKFQLLLQITASHAIGAGLEQTRVVADLRAGLLDLPESADKHELMLDLHMAIAEVLAAHNLLIMEAK